MFTAQEQAALAWAERVTEIAGDPIEDEEYEDARKVFSEKELVDMTLVIGVINAFNRLAISFQAAPAAVKAYERAMAQK
jgi:alkylhydroperoxidase family enzyme